MSKTKQKQIVVDVGAYPLEPALAWTVTVLHVFALTVLNGQCDFSLVCLLSCWTLLCPKI